MFKWLFILITLAGVVACVTYAFIDGTNTEVGIASLFSVAGLIGTRQEILHYKESGVIKC